MGDPASAVMMAIHIAKALYDQAQLMAKNREDCGDLASRLRALTVVLEANKSNRHFLDVAGEVLARLLRDMQNAEKLISGIMSATTKGNKKAVLQHFFGAGDDAAQLRELNSRITQHLGDLNAAIATANARKAEDDASDVRARLDRTTLMLEKLQGLLIAASVTDAMGPSSSSSSASSSSNNNGRRGDRGGGRRGRRASDSQPPVMRVKRHNKQSNKKSHQAGIADEHAIADDAYRESNDADDDNGSEEDADDDEDDDDDDDPASDDERNGQQQQHQQQQHASARSQATVGPRLGRALEVAAHQFVFGSFMVGLAMLNSDDQVYQIAVLLLSPLLPSGLMGLVYAAALLHMRRLQPDPALRMPLRTVFGSVLAKSLVPLQLYATPTVGGLAALAGKSYLGWDVGISAIQDYHSGLTGVFVGVLVFAASFLANAR